MNLPTLLRRLQQTANDRDRRGVREVLAALGREAGWARDVDDFVAHLSDRDRSFIHECKGV